MKKFFLLGAAAMIVASASAATEWVPIIKGGKAVDGETASIQAGWSGPAKVVDNPAGAGVVFETPIAADPTNPWDSQMFIVFDEALTVGAKYKVSFEYYCSDARTISAQAQGEPGDYHHWNCGVPDLEAKTAWQTVNVDEFEVNEEMAGSAGFKTIAFNLASAPEAATFYVNNVEVFVAKEVEEPVVAVLSLIEGGVAADGETASIQAGWSGPAKVVENPAGEGVVFECPIAADPENPWDSQLFIVFNEGLQEGETYSVSFDYYCSDSRSIDIQAQGEPGGYQHWFCGVDPLQAKPEWQSVNVVDFEVTAEMAGAAGFKTMAFNLASAPEAATFYINNVKVTKPAPGAVETIAPVQVKMTGVYNLNGVKVADELNSSLPKGIYIVNGKKVVR